MHTASLFPGDAGARRPKGAVPSASKHRAWPRSCRASRSRSTAINAGHEVVFLIAGEDKADAVARAFGDAPGPHAPASLVRPHAGNLTLLLDPGAAARL